jgi:predicted small secreted protein
MLPGLYYWQAWRWHDAREPDSFWFRDRNECIARTFHTGGIQALLGGSIMRKLVGLVVVAGALMVSACNTVEGAGKDVSSAGKTVAKTANDAK